MGRKAGKNPPKKRQAKHRGPWADIVYKNEELETYYKAQAIIPESELDAMFECLKQSLPSTFRINQAVPGAERRRNALATEWTEKLNAVAAEQDKAKAHGVESEQDDPITPPLPIVWYPNKMAWQLNLSRKQLRKAVALQELHQYVMAESQLGNFLRQEAVSMIPPLLFDMKPHHKILDICAAPGSKTVQLMELLAQSAIRDGKPITGNIVANDSAFKRCQILVTQTIRLSELLPHLIITNHDARHYPSLKAADGTVQKFDCILADVVCTGDGTMRKSPDLWKTWKARIGNSTHKMQVKILQRCMNMVKPGGQIVYSTCSLNPVEDEAVVLYCIKSSKKKFTLVDCSNKIPGLKYAPGVKTWKVMNNKHELMRSQEEAPDKVKYPASLFPVADEEWMNNVHVERCMRFIPHYHDSGGFFAAVLQRDEDDYDKSTTQNKQQSTEKCNEEDEEATAADDDSPIVTMDEDVQMQEEDVPDTITGEEEEPPKESAYTVGKQVKPIQTSTRLCDWFIPIGQSIVEKLQALELINFPYDQLFRREKGLDGRKLIFVSKESGQMLNDMHLRKNKWLLVNSGVRCLEWWQGGHQAATTCYRLTLEGMGSIMPYMPKHRITTISKTDLLAILSSQDRKVRVAELQNSPELVTTINALKPPYKFPGGGVVLGCKDEQAGPNEPAQVYIPAHYSPLSDYLFVFVANSDKNLVYYRLGEPVKDLDLGKAPPKEKEHTNETKPEEPAAKVPRLSDAPTK